MLIVSYFTVIALMRCVQSIYNKKVSILLTERPIRMHFVGYQNLVSAIAAVLFMMISGGFSGLNIVTVALGAFMGFSLSTAAISAFQAFKVTTIVLVIMFANASIIIPTIGGIFLFNEAVSIAQWIGVFLFILSATLLVKTPPNTNAKISFNAVFLLFIVFASNGLSMLLQKYFAINYPSGNISLFNFSAFFTNAVFFYIVFLTYSIGNRKLFKPLSSKLYSYGAMLSIAVLVIGQLITLAAKTVPSAVLFTVSGGISIVITAIVSAVIFKEKITLMSAFGIIVGLIAITVISVG